MNARKLILPTLITLCTLVVVCTSPSLAQAAIIHDFLPIPSKAISEGVPAGAKAAGGEEALSGPLGSADTMTVSLGETLGESGHLWVAGEGDRVDEFNASSGKWESQLEHAGGLVDGSTGVAVGESTGEREVYADRGEAVAVFGPTGKLQATWTGSDTPPGFFEGEVGGVATDDSGSLSDWAKGDVYVSTRDGFSGSKVVDVFKPEKEGKEKYVTQLKGTCPVPGATVGGSSCEEAQIIGFTEPGVMTVDPRTGDLLVVDESGVDVFEPVGLDEYRYLLRITSIPGHLFEPHGIRAVAAGGGEGDGDIYIAESEYYSFTPMVVYQFDSEGVYLGSLTGATPTSPFRNVRAVAVDPETGDVYVGDNEVGQTLAVDVFGPNLVVPDVTTGAPSEVTPSSVVLNGTVNPLDEGAATCRFAWGATSELGQTVKCAAGVPEGGAPVDVRSEALAGLQPDTRYYYRLQASNKNGMDTGEGSPAECEGKPAAVGCFTTSGATVENSVSDVASTSATLDAEVEPNNAPTSYYFEYGPTAAYGSDVPPAPGTAIGAGKGVVAVSQHLQGLAASSTYHYRAVAVSEIPIEVSPGKFELRVETFDGPDQTFTTQGVGTEFRLPDGRAWEMVSPLNKEGALIMTIGQLSEEGSAIQAAANGDAMAFPTSAPTEAEPQGNDNFSQDLSRRGPDGGWSTQDITPPNAPEVGTSAAVGRGENYRLFSSDLSLAVVQPIGEFFPLSPEASEQTAYLHTDFVNGDVEEPCESGCYRPLVTGTPGYADVRPGAHFGTPPGVHCPIICGPLFLGATPDLNHIVLLSGELTETQWTTGPCGCGEQVFEWSAGKPPSEELQPLYRLPNSEGGDGVTGISESSSLADNGSVFFFYHHHLYLHDVEKGESVRLDVAQGVAEPSEGGVGGLLDVSSDGSVVLFGDSRQLTKATGGGIYACRIVEVAGALSCGGLELTGLSGGRLIGGGEDLSYLYVAGAGNALYADHYTGTRWTQTDIATVPIEDATRVSPNGQWLAFMSDQDLTGYNTHDAFSGVPDEEVYLYNASAARLVCASCDPTGALPVGSDQTSNVIEGVDRGRFAALIPGPTPFESGRSAYQSRSVSDSGRLFFDSYGALVPQDVNGTWDVYEYESPGVGDCTTSSATFGERSGGCVGLISSGASAEGSAFMDASEDGNDVFFVTTAQLVPQDRDSALDVYDAHVCSEQAPCPAVTSSPPPCTTGDACKPAPTPQPTLFGAPSSETFSGAGNVTPATAPAVTVKALTRAQKLAKALKACRKRPKKRRAQCERRARRAYGSAARTKRSRKGGR